MRFEIKNKKFLINGKPIKIISGAVHYFRNMPDTWPDIFDKMRALGCNTVETYCAWNMHEKHPGEYDFEGILNITEFIRTAQEHNLYVILRPGPYICAEWEFGGLPWWIQNDKDIEIRCSNRAYMLRLKKYLERLFGEIRPLLISNGGPIIMVQCENEYGYYGAVSYISGVRYRCPYFYVGRNKRTMFARRYDRRLFGDAQFRQQSRRKLFRS